MGRHRRPDRLINYLLAGVMLTACTVDDPAQAPPCDGTWPAGHTAALHVSEVCGDDGGDVAPGWVADCAVEGNWGGGIYVAMQVKPHPSWANVHTDASVGATTTEVNPCGGF